MFQSRFLLWGQNLIESGGGFLLAPISWIWGFVSFCKNWLYDRGWLKAKRVNCVVVSVGNIVAGGTGKTPLVHLLAKTFANRRVAILTRGYGAIPDEALLLKQRLPGARIYIGKDRAASASKAIAEGAEVLILDDGFQHRKLARDFDLVMLDGKDPFGRGHYLPWGFLRDRPERLEEADALFVQGGDYFGAIGVETEAVRIVGAPSLEGHKVGVFSGIAKPWRFKKTVALLGAEVGAEWILADHEAPELERLGLFAEKCKSLGMNYLVCTEKDFVKIPPGISLALPLVYVEVEMEIVSGKEEWEKLVEKIDQKIDNHTHLCQIR